MGNLGRFWVILATACKACKFQGNNIVACVQTLLAIVNESQGEIYKSALALIHNDKQSLHAGYKIADMGYKQS